MYRARPWARSVGVTALVLVSLCASFVALPHVEGLDDFACSPVAISHDETAHYIGAAPSTVERDAAHCFLCHSLRSFHPAFDKYEHHAGAFRAELLHAVPVAVADRVDWSLVPGRAPPA